MNLRQHLKFIARGYLSHAKPSPIVVGVGGFGMMTLLDILSAEVTGEQARNEAVYNAAQSYLQNSNAEYYMNAIMENQPTMMQSVLSALLSLMVLMISTGIVIYIISEARYHKGSFGNLFDGLPILVRVVWYQFITTILVALWSMLLIVPGIIAIYRYRQGLYILIDHPEMSVMDCIRASDHMMKGHKMELFLLDMSFLGWSLSLSLLNYLFAMAMGSAYLAALLALPMTAFVQMYMEFTFFLYYEHLCGVRYDSRQPDTTPAA